MTNNEEQRGIVILRLNEADVCDNIQMETGNDDEGEHYTVFDCWDDKELYIKLVREALSDEKLFEYEIEEIMQTNLVFSDEYSFCTECSEVIRTSPNGHGWQPDYYLGDGFIICSRDFKESEEHQEAYLNALINNTNKVNQLISEDQLTELGFVKLNDNSYERGLHFGQNDSPKEIYEKFNESYEEIIFTIDSMGQFETEFSVWGRHEIEIDEREIS